jgi:hypothetical protein
LTGFFRTSLRGCVAGFLTAGQRVAGPRRLPVGRPGERPAGFGAAAGEPSAHSSRGNPRRTTPVTAAVGSGSLPRQPLVAGELAGQAELGVGGQHQPGPAVGLFGMARPRRRPTQGLLGEPDRVLQVEPADVRPPGKVQIQLHALGPGPLDLDLLWRAYIRRFDLEHTIRFAKQTLGWTIPRPRTPEQADRWTWLVLAAYTQLRLARQIAGDQRLPWERPRPQPRLSPLRVRRGFPRLLCALDSPASTPKPFGRSPGRPRGRCSGPATRYPAIKKPATKPRKKPSKTSKAT